MSISRRGALRMGGGLAASFLLAPVAGQADGVVEIAMAGRADGSHVWFDPIGILIQPGQTIRWINRDNGNSQSATAYHPRNFDRPRRMPVAAAAWDSGYLLPGEAFTVTLTAPGVYDYYCVPHELAGMVGRLIVGSPRPDGWLATAAGDGDLPPAAAQAFPAVEEIMKKGIVRRT
jgi:plastocyanin